MCKPRVGVVACAFLLSANQASATGVRKSDLVRSARSIYTTALLATNQRPNGGYSMGKIRSLRGTPAFQRSYLISKVGNPHAVQYPSSIGQELLGSLKRMLRLSKGRQVSAGQMLRADEPGRRIWLQAQSKAQAITCVPAHEIKKTVQELKAGFTVAAKGGTTANRTGWRRAAGTSHWVRHIGLSLIERSHLHRTTFNAWVDQSMRQLLTEPGANEVISRRHMLKQGGIARDIWLMTADRLAGAAANSR